MAESTKTPREIAAIENGTRMFNDVYGKINRSGWVIAFVILTVFEIGKLYSWW